MNIYPKQHSLEVGQALADGLDMSIPKSVILNPYNKIVSRNIYGSKDLLNFLAVSLL